MESPRHPDPGRDDVVPAGDASLDLAGAEAPAEFVAPMYGGPWRALFGFVALAMAFVAAILVVGGGGWTGFVLAAGAALVGMAMGYFAITGREPRLYSPSRRFMELADPVRPLTAGDLGPPGDPHPSTGLPAAREPVGQDTVRDNADPDSRSLK